MKTLYVTDLDGTLFGADSEVSSASAAMLGEAARRGALVTVATARTPATVQGKLRRVAPCRYRDAQGAQRELPAIVMTGAGLWERGAGRFRSVELLDEAKAREVCATMAGAGLRPFVYCIDREGREGREDKVSSPLITVYHPAEMSQRERSFYDERSRLPLKRFRLGHEPGDDGLWGRVALFFATGAVGEAQRACEALRQGGTGVAAAWYPDIFNPATALMDVYAPGVSKAGAVERLARETGAGRVVVFGDNLNDLPMMRVADVSVAPSNALAEVRRAASVVIGPNTADSVARFILDDINDINSANLSR